MYIFDIFFNEYKEKIKSTKIKLKRNEILMIALYLVSAILLIIFKILNLDLYIQFSPLILIGINLIVVYIYVKKTEKKTNQRSSSGRFINTRIEILTDLIKKPQYNFYSSHGIDWLLTHCERMESEHEGIKLLSELKKYFVIAIYPIITLVIGIIIGDMSSETILSMSISIVLLLIAVFCLYMAVKPIIQFLVFPQRDILRSLKENLEYIKLQIEQASQTVNSSKMSIIVK